MGRSIWWCKLGIFFTARLCFWGECVCSLDFQVKMHTTVTRGGPHCLTPFSKSLSAQGNLHVCTSVIHFLFLKPLTHVLALEIPQVSMCHEARQRELHKFSFCTCRGVVGSPLPWSDHVGLCMCRCVMCLGSSWGLAAHLVASPNTAEMFPLSGLLGLSRESHEKS